MLREQAHAGASHEEAETTSHATEAHAPAHFSAAGPIPAVASESASEESARPSASDLAYKEPFLTGDIMYEQLAHRFAYRDSLSAEDRAWLKNQGLEAKA